MFLRAFFGGRPNPARRALGRVFFFRNFSRMVQGERTRFANLPPDSEYQRATGIAMPLALLRTALACRRLCARGLKDYLGLRPKLVSYGPLALKKGHVLIYREGERTREPETGAPREGER
ncbi:MAG: hypothetical protein ACLFTT_08750, partial [Candidatus Hydrogenedentota bacterium]